MTNEEAIEYLKWVRPIKPYSLDKKNVQTAIDMAIEALKDRPHGECNQCRYYEGVHGVQGHAPCSFWGIGGVMWNDYCSRHEREGDEK